MVRALGVVVEGALGMAAGPQAANAPVRNFSETEFEMVLLST